MSGYWDSAMDYLHDSIQQGSQQSRTDLLPATINSMYAAEDLAQAVHYLKRGLTAAFGVREAQVWFCQPQENYLHLVGPANQRAPTPPGVAASQKAPKNPEPSSGAWSDLAHDFAHIIPVAADRLEARAYRQRVPLRGQERDLKIVRAIPLMIPGQKAIGVVTIFDELINQAFVDLRERDQQLVGFLTRQRVPCKRSTSAARSLCWPAGCRPACCLIPRPKFPAGKYRPPGSLPERHPAISTTSSLCRAGNWGL